jgi:uncharacterized protein (TIGR02996 family)
MSDAPTETPNRPEVVALLQGVKQNPADDAPRLVLADWLEEHGDPRGEFVRLQVHLERQAGEGPPQEEWRRREEGLHAQHRAAWVGPLQLLVRDWTSHRGLLRLNVHTSKFLTRPGMALAATEAYAWVDGVQFRSITAEGLRRFTLSPLWPALNTLGLWSCRLGDEDVRTLAAAPGTVPFTYLNLADNGLGPGAATALAGSPRMAGLTALHLHQNRIGPAGAAALAGSPYLGRLNTLVLYDNRIGDEGVTALAGSPNLAHVTTLNLSANDISTEGLKALLASPHRGRLRELSLLNNRIDAEGIRLLAESPAVSGLTGLYVAGNRFGPAGAEALAASPYLTGLTRLGAINIKTGSEVELILRRRFGKIVC